MPLYLLTHRDIELLLSMEDCISLQEQAFRLLAAGEVASAPNVKVSLPLSGGHFKLMVACQTRDSLAVVKTIHRSAGRPGLTGAILLIETRRNELLAIMHASHITALRTGAVAGMAARYLARQGAQQVAILGAGAVAWAAVEALALQIPGLRCARVYSRTATAREVFATRASAAVGWSVRPAEDPAAAVAGADIIVCATTSPTPILRKQMITPGCCILLIGSRSEVAPDCLPDMRVVVDSKDTARNDAPTVALFRNASLEVGTIDAELAEMITGKGLGRTSPEQTVLFISSGLPVQDLVCAKFCYERAAATRAGILVGFN